jgi:AcrR family transcriptional regulator
VPTAKLKLSVAAPAPAHGRRARTYEALISSAMALARHGRIVSVAEVASAAGVSRATAYRYFPSHSSLIGAIVQESLGPVRRFESKQREGRSRIRDLFDQTFPRFKEFEPQLRAALQLALEHWAREKGGTLSEEPYRRGHRIGLLARAAAPLKDRLGQAMYERLLKALSVVYGIESYVVLKDIWGASDRETAEVSRWMVDALIDAAMRDAGRAAGSRARPAAAASPSGSVSSGRRPRR